MYEQNTSAFVLGRESVGEHDSLIVLYTKDLGKVLARVTSGEKISSKLSPHLQVGNKVAVRLVERKIMRVADALSFPLNLSATEQKKRLSCLSLLSHLSVDLGPDTDIWNFLEKGEWSTIKLLKILGLLGNESTCFSNDGANADYFSLIDGGFYCATCSSRADDRLMYKLF